MNRNQHTKLYLFFFLYSALMLWLLFGRIPNGNGLPFEAYFGSHINLIPFRTIHRFSRLLVPPVRPAFLRMAINNLLGNVLLFIPLGYFLPRLFSGLRKFWRTLLSTCVIMSLVEILQLLLMVGTCDIDDLILNAFGSALGYGVYKLCSRKQ